MDLQHIPLSNLKVAVVNVRHGRKPPDVSDILPSIRARGVLQPLLVRPNEDGFEIIAGRRRYFAASKVAEEQGAAPDEVLLPCAVTATGDDTGAMEASFDSMHWRSCGIASASWLSLVRFTYRRFLQAGDACDARDRRRIRSEARTDRQPQSQEGGGLSSTCPARGSQGWRQRPGRFVVFWRPHRPRPCAWSSVGRARTKPGPTPCRGQGTDRSYQVR